MAQTFGGEEMTWWYQHQRDLQNMRSVEPWVPSGPLRFPSEYAPDMFGLQVTLLCMYYFAAGAFVGLLLLRLAWPR